ncbi:MAG TPA: hypothetical protein PKN85_03070 [Syntrophorhabdaceae bacterium]|nr:hypothetical protein [Syntrophorhabdaceae bacterium]HOD75728.1 hypothetical protein [Syntrophorhabdaceae bacterium]
MNDGKKKGIILIIIGICIPLFALPFVSGLDINKGFMDNFYNAGIRITKSAVPAPPETAAGKPSGDTAGKNPLSLERMRIERIPFRFFLVPTFILLYIGIVMIDRAKSREKKTGHV